MGLQPQQIGRRWCSALHAMCPDDQQCQARDCRSMCECTFYSCQRHANSRASVMGAWDVSMHLPILSTNQNGYRRVLLTCARIQTTASARGHVPVAMSLEML
jgi:hypothetical protein